MVEGDASPEVEFSFAVSKLSKKADRDLKALLARDIKLAEKTQI